MTAHEKLLSLYDELAQVIRALAVEGREIAARRNQRKSVPAQNHPLAPPPATG